MRRSGAAAEHCGDPGHQRVIDLLRADEMNVGVEAASGEDFAFAGDHIGARPDDDGDVRLNVGIAGLADGRNLSFLDADVGFDDAPMVEDQRIGDDRVDRARPVGDLRLPHAVADDLAAAELHLLAINREVLLDFDDQVGVGEPYPVTFGRAEHVGVDGAAYLRRHDVLRVCLLEHDPEKWLPVFRKDHAPASKSPELSPHATHSTCTHALACYSQRAGYHRFQIDCVRFCRMREIAEIRLTLGVDAATSVAPAVDLVLVSRRT